MLDQWTRRRRRRSGGGGGGVPPVTETDFGALTKSGAGGVPVSGTSIASGDALGHWQIVSGRLCPSATGDTADLNAGPYSLVFDDASTMAVTIIPAAYSVRDIDELRTVGALAALAFGDQVLCRAGSYNPTYADKRITRTAAITGSWTGSNYVVFKPHDGAVCDLHRLDIYGTTVENNYMEFTGFRFVATGASATIGCIRLWNNASFIYVHDNTSNTTDPGPTAAETLSCYFYSSANTGAGNLRIENNVWHNAYKTIVASGNDLVIKGNVGTNAYSDFVQVTPPIARMQIIGNEFTDKKSAYTPYTVTAITRGATTAVTVSDATGISVSDDVYFSDLVGCEGLIGGKYNISAIVGNVLTVGVNSTGFTDYVSGGIAKVTGIHGDFFQVVGATAADGDLDDVVFRGNQMTRGQGTAGDTEGQGIFLADNGAGVYYRNLLIEGNIVETTFVAGISIQNPLNAIVRNNVAIAKLGHSGYSGVTRISFAGTGTGNSCLDNVSNAFNFAATVETQDNNYTLTKDDASAYAAAFDAPPTGEGATNADVAYAPKAGGPLATATYVIGALPHQSFVSPWTYTDPRPAGTAALFQSANAAGWTATYATPPTFAPDVTPEYFTVTRDGYDSTGTATTYTEDLVVTERLRQVYPNEGSLTSDRVALSDYVYSTDTILGATNNSTEVSPKPVAQWGLPDRVVVGNTLTGEILAFHRNGVAAVEVRATDGTMTVTTLVTALTVSSQTNDRNAVLVYAFSLDISTLNDNANITLNAKVFPRIGGAASVRDSADQSNIYQFSPRTYRKNTSRASAPPIVYVASGGNDTTGAVSTTDATAAASPCLTLTGAVNRARAVLGTAAGDLDGLRVRLTAGTWSRASSPTSNTINSAIIIEPGIGVAKADAIMEFGAANNTFGITYVRHSGITIRRQGAFYPFNSATGHCVFENCDLDFNGQTGALAGSATVFFFVGTTVTGQGSSVFAAGSPVFALFRGCSWGTANSTATIEPNAIIGCDIRGCRTANGARDISGGMIAFNTWLQAGQASGPVISVNQTGFSTIDGYAIVQNVFEYTSASSNPAWALSHDDQAADTTHFILWQNTIAGFDAIGRGNLFYDETTADQRNHKLMSCVGNIHVSINNKGDVFHLDGTRIGNWPYLYGAGCRSEFSRYRDSGSGSFAQEYPGLGASIGTTNTGAGNDPLFTTYAGTTTVPGAGAGLGDYTLQSGSPAADFVSGLVLPFDLAGTARNATATAAGAYRGFSEAA